MDSLELARTEDGKGWVLASADGFPVRGEVVDRLLADILATRMRDPVGTTPASHKALGVSEEAPDRRVTLSTDQADMIVLFGRGPRSQVHVRRICCQEVYVATGLSLAELRTDASGFIDNAYLNLDKDSVSRIELHNAQGDFDFTKGDGGAWELAALPPGRILDQEKVRLLLTSLARVSIAEPVGKQELPEYGLDEGATVTLVAGEGDDAEVTRYRVGADAGKQTQYVKSDASEFVVKSARYSVEQALIRRMEDFLVSPDGGATQPGAGAAMPGGMTAQGMAPAGTAPSGAMR